MSKLCPPTLLEAAPVSLANAEPLMPRTNPPIKAREPVAARTTAAFVVDIGAALPVVEAPVGVEVLVAIVVERVMLEVGLANELDVVLKLVLFTTAVELLVYAVPVPTCMVTVLVELALAELLETAPLVERPVTWNGKEYWKIEVSESRVIMKP